MSENAKGIARYFEDSADLLQVADAAQIRAAAALLQAVEVRKREVERQIRMGARLSDLIGDDVRYKLGELESLNWILELPERAKKHLENIESEEE